MEDPLGQPRGARGEVEQEGVGGQGGHPVQGVRLLGQGGQEIQETVLPRAQGEPEGDLGLLCGGQMFSAAGPSRQVTTQRTFAFSIR